MAYDHVWKRTITLNFIWVSIVYRKINNYCYDKVDIVYIVLTQRIFQSLFVFDWIFLQCINIYRIKTPSTIFGTCIWNRSIVILHVWNILIHTGLGILLYYWLSLLLHNYSIGFKKKLVKRLTSFPISNFFLTLVGFN